MRYSLDPRWTLTVPSSKVLNVSYNNVPVTVKRYGGATMQIGGQTYYWLPDLERIRAALDAYREAEKVRERIIEEIAAQAQIQALAKAQEAKAQEARS